MTFGKETNMTDIVDRVYREGIEARDDRGFVVRLATPGDLDAVAALFDAYRVFYLQPSDVARGRAFLEQRYALRESVVLVAQDASGALLGFTQLYPSFTSAGTARIWILNDLFVDPAHRRGGVGKALIHAAVSVARRTGAVAGSLATQETNTAAQALYEALGFNRDTTFRHYRLKVE